MAATADVALPLRHHLLVVVARRPQPLPQLLEHDAVTAPMGARASRTLRTPQEGWTKGQGKGKGRRAKKRAGMARSAWEATRAGEGGGAREWVPAATGGFWPVSGQSV